MATTSYLEAVSGGMVAAAAFSDDDAAVQAVTLLRESGVREQDICVLASDSQRAALVAGGRAWLPGKGWGGLRYRLRKLLPGGIIPRDVRKRYANALNEGKIVVLAAADGQPPDTIAALLEQARGEAVEQWWQQPTYLFAPPELAGPF
ncbi:MAG TPA: hypothetical protein VGS01_15950 [Candidatus Limnocylindria bacterium]|jgi:hypothetical protein|nr:hypothetical protein [Candidatus Limnocylindria bacterium]